MSEREQENKIQHPPYSEPNQVPAMDPLDSRLTNSDCPDPESTFSKEKDVYDISYSAPKHEKTIIVSISPNSYTEEDANRDDGLSTHANRRASTSSSSSISNRNSLKDTCVKNKRWYQLVLLSASMVCIMSLWFTAGAIIPSLRDIYNLDTRLEESLLTATVNFGFVVGGTIVSISLLGDWVQSSLLMASGGFFGGAFNLSLLASPQLSKPGLYVMRFLTGMALSLVYGPGMKAASIWFTNKRRGLVLGIMVGALTLGSSLPNLIKALSGSNLSYWNVVIIVSTVICFTASFSLISFAEESPLVPASHLRFTLYGYLVNRRKKKQIQQQQSCSENDKEVGAELSVIRREGPKKSFKISQVPELLTTFNFIVPTLAYSFHAYELYAWWSWCVNFYLGIIYSDAANASNSNIDGVNYQTAYFYGFVVFGPTGVIGCVVGGLLADKFGRINVCLMANSISLLVSAIIGPASQYSSALPQLQAAIIWTLGCIWGVFCILESAQYSCIVAELSAPELVGTSLILQMAMGYAFTIIAILCTPLIADTVVGWTYVYTIVSGFPLMSIVCLLVLRYKGDKEDLLKIGNN